MATLMNINELEYLSLVACSGGTIIYVYSEFQDTHEAMRELVFNEPLWVLSIATSVFAGKF
jgi:hypothetical protein